MDRSPEGSSKEIWRRWARRVRRDLDLEEAAQAVVEALAAWEPLRRASRVLFYLPMPGELDLRALVGRLPEVAFVVTRTPARGPLTLHRLEGELERHEFGFLQPVDGTPPVEVETIDGALVPGLAFDRRGIRLGYGKGYFDELLARLRPGAPRVGVAPEALVVPRLPEKGHDVRVTHLATERGVCRVEE